MTVIELIQKLRELPSDAIVLTHAGDQDQIAEHVATFSRAEAQANIGNHYDAPTGYPYCDGNCMAVYVARHMPEYKNIVYIY